MTAPVHPAGDPRSLFEALRVGRLEGEEARLRAATSLLESVFYEELFKVMRETVPDGDMGGGLGEDVFAGLMDQHVAEEAASRAERGLGAALYRHFAGALLGPGGGEER